MDFEWDETKARANEKKHGVSFIEAAEVFGDDYSSCVHDPDHSSDEERYLLFGVSSIRRFPRCVIYRKVRHNSYHFSAAYD